MSLTSFLKIPEVRERFKANFLFEVPVLDERLKAPPLTLNYQLVGTAFDYLLRFHLEKINKNVLQGTWVAEHGVELAKSNRKIHKNLVAVLDKAKETHLKFLKTGTMNRELIKTSLELAKLDGIFRARHRGIIFPDMKDIQTKDISDLQNLISLVNDSVFKSKKITILNPTFGTGSKIVGGADADLVIDDTLIDIKTTKDPKFKKDYYFQLIGYYILYKIGGIDGIQKSKIKNVAVYFSRQGILHKIPVSTFENSKFKQFIEWFQEQAEFENEFKKDFGESF
ncbi:MAG: hypothetical protein ACREA7_07020 [Nitrosotalea sp.]